MIGRSVFPGALPPPPPLLQHRRDMGIRAGTVRNARRPDRAGLTGLEGPFYHFNGNRR
jgi:hypothetical protein